MVCHLTTHQPTIHEVSSLESLNTSMVDFFDVVVKGDKDQAFLSTACNVCIDVRDTAAAHVLAGETEAAGGERIIVKNGTYLHTSTSFATNAVPMMCLRLCSAFLLAGVQCVTINYLATIDPHHLVCPLVDVANSINPPILKTCRRATPV